MKSVTMDHPLVNIPLVPLSKRFKVMNNLQLGGGEQFNNDNGQHSLTSLHSLEDIGLCNP